MGYAKILSGGPDGRYTIELDWGEATKVAILAEAGRALNVLDTKLAEQALILADAEESEAGANEAIEALIAEYAADVGSANAAAAVNAAVKALRALQVIHSPIRRRMALLKQSRADLLKKIAYWNNFQPIETRPAWCTDYTEDAAPGSFVATMDIPGDSGLLVLAPGARSWNQGDGVLTAREVMSPPQALWNAAILPGWAKFKPTYRTGTITALNFDADTASVTLAPATLTGQRLDVNQATSLVNVPVVYMECNARIFEIGDRCVVQFIGQEWNNPRVVGFVDNPRPCIDWPDVVIPVRVVPTPGNNPTTTRFMRFSSNDGSFSCNGEWTTYSGTSPGNTEGANEIFLRVSYGTPGFNAPAPLFTLNVGGLPGPVDAATAAGGGIIRGSGLANAGAPIPGSEASYFELVDNVWIKYTASVTQYQLNIFSFGLDETCVLDASYTYFRYSAVPIGLSPSESEIWRTNYERASSIFSAAPVFGGEPYEVLGDPVITVTYNGLDEPITAEYHRVGQVFKRKRIIPA